MEVFYKLNVLDNYNRPDDYLSYGFPNSIEHRDDSKIDV